MSEEKPVVVGVDYATENCREVAVHILPQSLDIPGQEIHRPSRARGASPVFAHIDSLGFMSGESSHQTAEHSDVGAGLSWLEPCGRGRTGNTMEFIPGEEPNVNSAYAASYTRQTHEKNLSHDEKARLFWSQYHTPQQLGGLQKLANDLVLGMRPEPIEIKANISIKSADLELDADGNPTTLESAMALDAVDALCLAEDAKWKELIESEIGGCTNEAMADYLNQELIAEGRAPVFSPQMLSAVAAAELRKKQKNRKKSKRK